ncbi:MAG: hypothetical protein EA360_09060 [Balneolaceae bacterium]|nr:MAG: hypothetical protein EA360_09060 [Balneolaceae bacterium]
MKSVSPEIRTTGDGSTTLFSEQFSQHYHNPNGAVAESLHLFFETTGMITDIQNQKPLRLFETGFGTGLNLLLFVNLLEIYGYRSNAQLYSIEAWPVTSKTARQFSFGKHESLNRFKPVLNNIFSTVSSGWNRFEVTANCTLNLYIGTLADFFLDETEIGLVDYFLHDPFSPEVNAELWQAEVFREFHSMASSRAVLGTYCAASSARAAMASAGWFVARAPGALGKREMTLASTDPKKLDPWKRVDEKRLSERLLRGDFNR